MTVIITVAGISSRFNKNHEDNHLKAIYFEEDILDTLLYKLLKKFSAADRIIIVGGYKYAELKNYLRNNICASLSKKIVTVYNEFFQTYSSGYSLYVGLNQAFEEDAQTIVFAEGDLDVDTESVVKVISSTKNVITYTSCPIYSDKSVVLYQNSADKYKYIFNYEHGLLRIEEPFKCIFNSGQIWKFNDIEKLKIANKKFYEEDREDTNLGIIQRYFDVVPIAEIELIHIAHWLNCNTRDDYKLAKNFWRNSNGIF